MHVWFFGLLGALLGAGGATRGFTVGPWWFGVGGVVVVASALAFLARPKRTTAGALKLSWAAMVFAHFFLEGGELPSFADAYSVGSVVGVLIAAVVGFLGIADVMGPEKGSTCAPSDQGPSS